MILKNHRRISQQSMVLKKRQIKKKRLTTEHEARRNPSSSELAVPTQPMTTRLPQFVPVPLYMYIYIPHYFVSNSAALSPATTVVRSERKPRLLLLPGKVVAKTREEKGFFVYSLLIMFFNNQNQYEAIGETARANRVARLIIIYDQTCPCQQEPIGFTRSSHLFQ